jgi:hypothetical protein
VSRAFAAMAAVAPDSGFGAPQGVRAAVDVYLSSRGHSWLLEPGTPLASAIFKKIGVRLIWHAGELPAGQGAIGICIVEHAPKPADPKALASAQLPDSSRAEITIYEDRVQSLLDEGRGLAAVAIGYVLAHELAHVMQGMARQSESGILKAQWSSADWNEMMTHKLAFADSISNRNPGTRSNSTAPGANTRIRHSSRNRTANCSPSHTGCRSRCRSTDEPRSAHRSSSLARRKTAQGSIRRRCSCARRHSSGPR